MSESYADMDSGVGFGSSPFLGGGGLVDAWKTREDINKYHPTYNIFLQALLVVLVLALIIAVFSETSTYQNNIAVFLLFAYIAEGLLDVGRNSKTENNWAGWASMGTLGLGAFLGVGPFGISDWLKK